MPPTSGRCARAPKALARVSERRPKWSVFQAAPLALRPHWRSSSVGFLTTRTVFDEPAREFSDRIRRDRHWIGLWSTRVGVGRGGIDGGEPEDAAMATQLFDSAHPAPSDSALGLSGDSAITRPMQGVDAMLPMQPVDATLPIGTDDGAMACTPGGGGIGGSNGCMTNFGEMCGATNYQVVCSCPQATCVCFGPTTHVISNPFCPSCPLPSPGRDMTAQAAAAKVLAACGFP